MLSLIVVKISGNILVVKGRCPTHGGQAVKVPLDKLNEYTSNLQKGIFRCYKCGQETKIDNIKQSGSLTLIRMNCPTHGNKLPYQKIWSSIYNEITHQQEDFQTGVPQQNIQQQTPTEQMVRKFKIVREGSEESEIVRQEMQKSEPIKQEVGKFRIVYQGVQQSETTQQLAQQASKNDEVQIDGSKSYPISQEPKKLEIIQPEVKALSQPEIENSQTIFIPTNNFPRIEPIIGKNTFVIYCGPDWELDNIKGVIKQFCSGFSLMSKPLTLTEIEPNVIEGITVTETKAKYFGAPAPEYKGTFKIGKSDTRGKFVQIDYYEGSTFKVGKLGKKYIEIFWTKTYEGLNQVLSKTYSSFDTS